MEDRKSGLLRWGLIAVLVLAVITPVLWSAFPSFFYSMRPIEPEKLSGRYDSSEEEGVFYGSRVSSSKVPGSDLAAVLGDSNLPKRIEVDLSSQKLYAYEGDNKVYEFLISSGKWGRTPTGNFRIWGKSQYQKMSGGSGPTYYYLPNVPFIMWFSGDGVAASRGFSLHGTYWHNNFGHPMSHGCVNMRTEDAKTLFFWSDPISEKRSLVRADADNPGTEVIIYGTAPRE